MLFVLAHARDAWYRITRELYVKEVLRDSISAACRETSAESPWNVTVEKVEERLEFMKEKYNLDTLNSHEKYLDPVFCIFCRTPAQNSIPFNVQNKFCNLARSQGKLSDFSALFSNCPSCPGAAGAGLPETMLAGQQIGENESVEFVSREVLRKEKVIENFFVENTDLVCKPCPKWAVVPYQPKGEVRVKCRVCETEGIGIYTSKLSYMRNHVQQHRADDWVKVYRTIGRRFIRPEAHPQGGELYRVLNPTLAISSCGNYLECRHCHNFQRVFTPTDEATNAKQAGVMRFHEKWCKAKKK